MPRPPISTLFPYTTLFRSFAHPDGRARMHAVEHRGAAEQPCADYPVHLTTGRVLAQYQRSEEHTSELQSRRELVCRLLLEKKKEEIMPNMQIGAERWPHDL